MTSRPEQRRRPRASANVQPENTESRPGSQSRMKLLAAALLFATLLAPQILRAQASDIPSGAPPRPLAQPPKSAAATCWTR